MALTVEASLTTLAFSFPVGRSVAWM